MNGLTGEWIPSSIRQSTEFSMQYTKRRNLNRGYMKLEVWHRALDLFELAYRLAESVADFKLISSLESKRATGDWQDRLPQRPPT